MADARTELEELRRLDELEKKAAGGSKEKPSSGGDFLEEHRKAYSDFFRGTALPVLGALESVPNKDVQEFAAKQVKEIKETPEYQLPVINPRTLGQVGGETAMMAAPASMGLKATKVMSTVPKVLSRILGGGTIGASTSAFFEPVSDAGRIKEQKKESAITGGVIGSLFGGVPSLYEAAKKGLGPVTDTLKKYFNNDIAKMSDALRKYASEASGEEARIANQLAKDAEAQAGKTEKRALTAEEEAKRQAKKTEGKLGTLPGTEGAVEAGRMKAIADTKDAIGTRIKKLADDVMTKLKGTRDSNAIRLKDTAFKAALDKEKSGERVKNTKAFAETIKEINDILRNADTKLTNVSVSEMRDQLNKIKSGLQPKEVDPVTGVVKGKDLSFEGLENLRRFLNDRAYGAPNTGYDAISQQQAGKLADSVRKIMVEFSPEVETYLTQYKKDSEPLRVFLTKVGKALVDEQLLGKGANYATVAAEDVANRVFKNRESYQALVDALGGNAQAAKTEAAKFFTNEIERLKGSPQKVEDFLRENRTMLRFTGLQNMVEDYYRQVAQTVRRGEFAAQKAGAEKKLAGEQRASAEKLKARGEDFSTLQSKIITARTPEEVARFTDDFANKMVGKSITQEQYRKIMENTNKLLDSIADKEEAKRQIIAMLPRILGYGILGGAGVYAVKQVGE